jgi:hypothetical protein
MPTSRIPTLTIADAPHGACPLLHEIFQSSSTGLFLEYQETYLRGMLYFIGLTAALVT